MCIESWDLMDLLGVCYLIFSKNIIENNVFYINIIWVMFY